MARKRRGRPVENKHIGMAITDPTVSLTELARAQGLTVFGPVRRIEELDEILEMAFAAAEAGACVLVDVITQPPALES